MEKLYTPEIIIVIASFNYNSKYYNQTFEDIISRKLILSLFTELG